MHRHHHQHHHHYGTRAALHLIGQQVLIRLSSLLLLLLLVVGTCGAFVFDMPAPAPAHHQQHYHHTSSLRGSSLDLPARRTRRTAIQNRRRRTNSSADKIFVLRSTNNKDNNHHHQSVQVDVTSLLELGIRAPIPHHRRHRENGEAETETLEARTAYKDGNNQMSPIFGRQVSVYLLSLQWSSDEQSNDNTADSSTNTQRRFSSTVRSVWRWKDAVMGDGRDFFVPKPKTVAALQMYLASAVSASTGQACTVVVISNCARFEILVAVGDPNCGPNHAPDSSSSSLALSLLVTQISSLLVSQVECHRKRFQMAVPLDLPGAIDLNAHTNDPSMLSQPPQQLQQRQDAVDDLSQHWTVLEGPQPIAQHLALVAAGMASRPRRPDRLVLFQPFSSRDAHILLQLKRTLDVATQQHQKQQQQQRQQQRGSSSSSVLLILLQCALQAGKGARNTASVPELLELTTYGTGNNSKYDASPPRAVVERVMSMAQHRAVDPAVRDGVARIAVLAHAHEIGRMRVRSLALARNPAERVRVQQLLHEPTLQLRHGVRLHVDKILDDIESDLSVMRNQGQ